MLGKRSLPEKPTHNMRWTQLVGSLKLQVSFAEYCLFYRALLQKRHIILRSVLIVATPYVHMPGKGVHIYICIESNDCLKCPL